MAKIFLVGGAVRDMQMGVNSNDLDFTVETGSFEAMRQFLLDNHFTIFLETPEYFTIRARFPRNAPEIWPAFFTGPNNFALPGRLPTADFVLARKEGAYSDGRRPDSVQMGTLIDDLSRRDFTVNAMALSEDGGLIDPFNGMSDLALNCLVAVGNAEDRIREDALRALRAVRFCVTKGFDINGELEEVLRSDWLPELLVKVSAERRREELTKMFKCDPVSAMDWITYFPTEFQTALFAGGIWLQPTMKGS